MASFLDGFFYLAIPLIVVIAIIGKIFQICNVDENSLYKTQDDKKSRDVLNKKLNKHLWVVGFVFLLIYGLIIYEFYLKWGLGNGNTIFFGILVIIPVFVAGAAFTALYLSAHHLIAVFSKRRNGQR